jgi:F-type H+-transporting ATPase subunit b
MFHEMLPLLAADSPSALSSGLDAVKNVLGPFGVKPVLLLAQIVNFSIVAFIVYRFAIKPVIATVDERNKKISAGLQYTEDMKQKLADTETKQEEVLKQASLEGKKVIAEARDTGKAMIEKAATDATRTAEDILKKGHETVVQERTQMLNDLRREVAQLVVTTANRVLARDLTADERARFNTSAAQDLSKN